MKLLLDTHILLWSVTEPHRLTQLVAEALLNEANELWFSPISAWETLILAEKGKISLQPNPLEGFQAIIAELSLSEAPLTYDVAVRSRLIALSHQDPADRFIAATAVVYDLTLVTADARLLACHEISLLGNTG